MMPAALTTNATLTNTDPHEKAPWALVLLVIPLITVFGNVLVILGVAKNACLQTSINVLIAGLAMADLLVAVAVMPFAVYVLYNNNHWYLGGVVCDMYCAMDVTCSTASIVHLAVISFDRYMAVSRPLYYSRTSHKLDRACMTLAAVWAMSAAVASPMALGLNARGRAIMGRDDECRFYNADFILYSSIISFAIPLLILVVLYTNIFMVIRKRHNTAMARKIQQSIRKLSAGSKAKAPAPESSNLQVSQTSFRFRSDTNTTDEDDSERTDNHKQHKKKKKKFRQKGINKIMYRHGGVGSSGVLEHEDSVADDTSMECTYDKELLPTVVISVDQSDPQQDQHRLHVRRATTAVAGFKSIVESSAEEEEEEEPSSIIDMTHITNEGAQYCSTDMTSLTNKSNGSNGTNAAVQSAVHNTHVLFFGQTLSAPNSPAQHRHQCKKASSIARIQSAVGNVLHHKRFSDAMLAPGSRAQSAEQLQETNSLLKAAKARKKLMARERRKQRKATKTLAVVIGENLGTHLRVGMEVGLIPFIVTTWIGYMNSFMNPIIYTIFNQEFRAAFLKILGRSSNLRGRR